MIKSSAELNAAWKTLLSWGPPNGVAFLLATAKISTRETLTSVSQFIKDGSWRNSSDAADLGRVERGKSMTLSEFATISSAVSGLAVTISLVYLALQTHQAAKHTKALIQQGRTDRAVSAMLTWAGTDLAKAWLARNGVAATSEALYERQTSLMFECFLRGSLDSFAQREDGLLSKEQFGDQVAAIEQMMRLSSFRAYWNDWKTQRAERTPAFIAFVDGLAPRQGKKDAELSRSVYGAGLDADVSAD
jgi:hypothetical protein